MIKESAGVYKPRYSYNINFLKADIKAAISTLPYYCKMR